ncbi:MAG: GEVED domain-containing protein, partial [Bacteroidales bacterium]
MKKIYLLVIRSMLMPLLLFFGGYSIANAQYCVPGGLSCTAGDALQSFYTTGAAVNINNTNSGCSPNGYGDYTNDTLKITAGGSFVANVLPEYYAGAAIWIDFNQDYDFNDPGEKVFGHGAVFMSTMTGTVTIPLSGISYGPTRMRVAVGYVSEPSDPCSPGGFGYGEAEDYIINIQAPPQNDMLVNRIVVPDTTVLAGQSNIAIELVNAGVQNQTPSVSFSIDNGNNWINENVNQTINSGDTLLYNFTATADFSNPGNYTCVAAVNVPGDTVNPYNDTLTINVGSYLGKPIPFYENFETTSHNDWFSNYYDNYVSVTYSWRLDSGRTEPRNTGPLSDHTTAGSYDGRYITTKPSAVDAHYVSPYLDTTTYPANPELKFYYFLHGDGGNIYVEEKIDGIWHRIDSIIGPVQANMQEPWILQTTPLSSNASQFRFVGTNTGGGNIAIDDIYITGDNDLSVTDVIAPVPTIEQQNNTDVIIEITNLGYNTQSNFDVHYSIDGGITYITETVNASIDPDSTLIYTFNTSADMTTTGTYDMEFIVANSGDINSRNDTVHKIVRNMPMPYSQDFDNATPLNLPHGWDYNLGIDDGWVETRGSSSLTAPNSLNFWNGSADSGEPLMAILPPYYGSFADKWVQLWFDSNSDQDSVFVGVMDDPTDATTFTPTDTITFSQTSNYAPHYGLLSNYTGTGKYIAIRHSVSSTYSYMWMDNLLFETAPNGPRLSANPDSLD